ncbi:hypothetical protein [Stakelama pacifica]|uniref:GcrA cell cycle regulator n=1 Tax=Stakelama pacifica TaxID=517720 RepID=A0A4R6FN19_9SPHN|nr:hypothetical protein [Stakelama pacifica]TDN83001.1 hypothetical protein EV664_105199 [Stakelama pacifica]GGO94963.1 hypothetical protein GCM10011329_18030 [Stakelama pacifica]
MSGFAWTCERDRELIDGLRDGLSMRECSLYLGCTESEAWARHRFLTKRPARPDPARVPRPVFVAHPDRIDIRNAPSMMEARAAEWAKRSD